MTVLSVQSLSKSYQGFSSPWMRLLCGLSLGTLGVDLKYPALQDISFELEPGEALGILGRNGAGKSTLLKTIAGVLKPEKGVIHKQGSVRAMLELGVGFNLELSGRENLYYNALLWGFSPKRIRAAEEEIFSFAELEGFESFPLKQYSSGMAMRLAFSLATVERPSILIVDEALAVGDARFQQKCLKRIRDFLEAGSVLLLVSHDLSLLSHLCEKSLLLEKGRLVALLETKQAIETYMHLLADPESWSPRPDNEVFEKLEVFLGTDGQPRESPFFVGESLGLTIRFLPKVHLENLTIGFHIDDSKGSRLYGTNTFFLGQRLPDYAPGSKGELCFRFPCHFGSGKYSLGISFHQGSAHTEKSYFWSESYLSFEVALVSLPKFIGTQYLPVQVELIP